MEHTKVVVELLRDTERALWLPPAAPNKVNQVVRKIVAFAEEAAALQRVPSYDGADLAHLAAPRVNITTALRLRHCLLAYLRKRMERIEEIRWSVAGVMPDENLALLSENEKDYSREYNALLSEYQSQYDIDLTRDSTPPSDLLIKVHVLADVGQFIGPESGATLELKRGDNPFLRRGDVEHLVRQGKCRHLI